MSPKKTAELLGVLIVFIVAGSSDAQTNFTAELGQDFILPCKVPNNNIPITAVKWIRPDQDPEYVLFYRDGQLDPEYQHLSYQDRVDLQDKEMKDGDVSLVLKNVTMEDTGRYVCLVYQGRNKNPISIFNLEVRPRGDEDGGDQDGNIGDGGNKDIDLVGFIPPLVTAGIFMFLIGHVRSVICRERRSHN